MYKITFTNGTTETAINFTEACREIQSRPSDNWSADIRDWKDGKSEVYRGTILVATITVK